MPEYMMGTVKTAMTSIVVRIVTPTVTEAISCPPGRHCPVISEGKGEERIEAMGVNMTVPS